MSAVSRLQQVEKDLSIRGKIQYLFVCAFAASVIAALPILLLDAYAIHRHVQKSTSETILQFIEGDLAKQLQALDIAGVQTTTHRLSQLPQVDSFCLYNRHKVLIKSLNNECQLGSLPFVLVITDTEQQPVGYFYSATLGGSRNLIVLQIVAALGLITMFFLLSFFMLKRLQKVITQPLLALSRAAEAFMRTNDFHIRVQKYNDDEIGRLSEVFNRLLQDMRKKEHDLIKAKNDADIANAMKSDFLASVSHEIRTPMNGVIGTAELLLATVEDNKQRNYVSTILRSSESLLSIINDVLDFSKIESGKLDIECIPFNLYNEIEDVADLIAIKACEKQIEVIVSISPYIPENLLGDPSRVRQVLTNLVSNAVKFTERGHILIEVESVACSPSDPTLETIRFTVQDTGIGISHDAQQRIFERFTQAESSITRQYGGTGLGLAICKQLVELMGGTITVESAVGKGSTFTFTLNLTVNEQQPNEQAVDLENIHALIVDDNPFIIEYLKNALRFYGMRTDCALSPKQALKLIADNSQAPFDILIIDEHMPAMSGCTLAKKINLTYADRAPPIILLNEIHAHSESGHLYQRSGIAAYIQKPVRLKQLAELIKVTLHERNHGNRKAIISIDKIRGRNNPFAAAVRFANPNIVVLEKSDVHYKTLSKELIKAGCQVQRALDQRGLLNLARQHSLDLLIIGTDPSDSISTSAYADIIALRNEYRDVNKAALPVIVLAETNSDKDKLASMPNLASVVVSRQSVRTSLMSKIATLIPEFVLNPENALVYFQGVDILLVEDNSTNAQITAELLAEFGCRVQACENGKKAIEAFTSTFFDLVLMDCQMPIMDGFESTRRIREFELNGGFNATPIIALTANAMKGDSERCINVGMNDYIAKPIKRDKLRNILLRFIDQKKLIVKPGLTDDSPIIEPEIYQRTLQHYRASGSSTDHLSEDLQCSMNMLANQYLTLPPKIIFESVQVIMGLAKLLGFVRLYKALKALSDSALQLHGSELDASEALADRVAACQRILSETLVAANDSAPIENHTLSASAVPVAKQRQAPMGLEHTAGDDYASAEQSLPVPEVSFDDDATTTHKKVTFVNFNKTDNTATKKAELVDLETFNATKGIFKTKFERILREYLEDCESYIKTIERSLAASNFSNIRHSAHPLKSSSFSLGFNKLGEIAKRIEMTARQEEDIEAISQDVAPLLKTYAATKAFIDKERVS